MGGSIPPDPGPFTCGPVPNVEVDELGCERYPDELCPDPPLRVIDPRLELGFSGPSSIQGVPGTTVPLEVSVVLENSVEVTSWSISLSAIGCEVTGVELGSTLVCIGEPDITFHDEDLSLEESGAVAGLVLNPFTNTGPAAVA